jgi:hypothetical protein
MRAPRASAHPTGRGGVNYVIALLSAIEVPKALEIKARQCSALPEILVNRCRRGAGLEMLGVAVDRNCDRARSTVQGGARIVTQQHTSEDAMAA